MKKMIAISFIFSVAFLISCNNNQQSKQTGSNQKDSADSSAVAKTTDNPSYADTVLWIGIFSRWDLGPNEHYDGNYDTTNNIFIICSSHKSVVVPRSNVVAQLSGYCDTAFTNRVKIMQRIKSNNSASVIGEGLKLSDSTGNSNRAEFYLGNEKKIIELKRDDTKRFVHAVKMEQNATLKTKMVKLMPH